MYKPTRYTCAVLLILSSIVLAYVCVFRNDDIAHGVLLYIAQAFLLAGSIFGLDYYLRKFNNAYDQLTKRTAEQQSAEHSTR